MGTRRGRGARAWVCVGYSVFFHPTPSSGHIHGLGLQVVSVRDSVVEAFQHAEDHKQCYLPYRDMVLFHNTLDIPGLAPLFKAKGDPLPSEDSTSAEGALASLQEPGS